MARVIYVTCPRCQGQFYVGLEFFSVPESYCHCPYCAKEFPVYSGVEEEKISPSR